jgi:hypothetical protein
MWTNPTQSAPGGDQEQEAKRNSNRNDPDFVESAVSKTQTNRQPQQSVAEPSHLVFFLA